MIRESCDISFFTNLHYSRALPFLGSHFTIWFSASKQALTYDVTNNFWSSYLLGDSVHCKSLMVGFLRGDKWGVGGQGVVDTRIGHLASRQGQDMDSWIIEVILANQE